MQQNLEGFPRSDRSFLDNFLSGILHYRLTGRRQANKEKRPYSHFPTNNLDQLYRFISLSKLLH